ncbi:MAG: hypothetical protein GY865_08805 [candidate division Zixibacteria bacterium]|nr:hypothetical protein [candidate division Zixibacteria bacterium]
MCNSKNNKVVIIKNYRSEFPDPLILKKGERLKIGRKKTNYSGWIWCMDINGNGGWIPEKFVKITEDSCVMLVDYDATELTVLVGDELTILSEESGWVLCLNSNNQKGWVPLENVKRI